MEDETTTGKMAVVLMILGCRFGTNTKNCLCLGREIGCVVVVKVLRYRG